MHRYVLHIIQGIRAAMPSMHMHVESQHNAPAGIELEETLSNPIRAERPQASHTRFEKKRSEHQFTSEQNGPTPQ